MTVFAENTMMPADIIINALGGSLRTGMCRCPAHDDDRPSLSVRAGDKVQVLFYCHAGCTFEQIAAALHRMGLWPVSDTVAASPARSSRSAEERRQYARQILSDVGRNRGRDFAPLLKDYFAARGIERVPATALLALPWRYGESGLLLPTGPAMVFRVTDGQRTLGVHATWLNADLTGKREGEPQRQFYGPIKGGFIRLFRGRHDPKRLVIGEGVESACALAQISGVAAISALSAENMPFITPPPASEYIIAADNDANGTGERAARALARRLIAAGHAVRIAMPKHPDTDWNDEVMHG